MNREAVDLIKLVIGQKGTGKTRRMIEMANAALKESKGEIVFVNGENRRMIDLKHQIRFINVKEFQIKDLKVFYGFLAGMISRDYDTEYIYIDGLLDIIDDDLSEIEQFMFQVKRLSDKFKINFIITMNGNPDNVPAFLEQYIA
jgi:energy-coupling factor transporter ATP-binding protein EcfA2